jgi:hypothetical protein
MCARRRLSAADACGAASSVPVDGPKLNVCGSRPAPLLSSKPKASSAGRFWRCVGLGCRKPLSTWTLAPPMSPQALYALGHITYNEVDGQSHHKIHNLVQALTPMSLRQERVCCKTTEVCTFEGRMVTINNGYIRPSTPAWRTYRRLLALLCGMIIN